MCDHTEVDKGAGPVKKKNPTKLKQKKPLTCISPAVSVPYTGVLAAAEAQCRNEGQRREHLILVLLLDSFSCENTILVTASV